MQNKFMCHDKIYFFRSRKKEKKPTKKVTETHKRTKITQQPTDSDVSVIRRRLHDTVKSFPKGFDQKCQRCFCSQGHQNDWIGCNRCWRWYHCYCINNYDFDAQFYCDLCK